MLIIFIMSTGNEIRRGIEANWHQYLSKYGNLFSSKEIQGSSPPSIFVGTYGYPKVGVGPMVPPIHGETSILDMPEKWIEFRRNCKFPTKFDQRYQKYLSYTN